MQNNEIDQLLRIITNLIIIVFLVHLVIYLTLDYFLKFTLLNDKRII